MGIEATHNRFRCDVLKLKTTTVILIAELGLAAVLAGAASPAPPALEEVAAGLDVAHLSGRDGRLLLPEMMNPGAALVDVDGDGDLDLYFLQGGPLGAPPEADRPVDVVYRNDLGTDGRPHFVDITAKAGTTSNGYGMGVAVGDVNGDGDPDLFVANVGRDVLLFGGRGATFKPAADGPLTTGALWTNAATFLDYDRDGDLDLFVVHYVDFSPERKVRCYAADSAPDYCGPDAYEPVADQLFRNDGSGVFEDVTAAAGIRAAKAGAGLGVVAADLDGNGWIDLYVANDGDPNHLWLNQGDGTFKEGGLWAGVAVNTQGRAEAGMGVDAGDADGDGDLDLFVTHLKGETNTLYLQTSRGTWEDRTAGAGLAATSLSMNGFGTAFFDLENDGLLDLLVVNGLVRIPPENRAFDDGRRLGQPDQLFHNLGKARFEELGGDSIPALAPIVPSRGVAFGDVDNDGDTDAVLTVNEDTPRLLLNRAADGSRWIGLRLVTGTPPRDALGAEVRLTTSGNRVLLRRVHSDGGYAAGHDPRVIFGLGADAAGRTLDVRWPSGRHEVFAAPPVGRYTTLAEGSAPKTSKETP